MEQTPAYEQQLNKLIPQTISATVEAFTAACSADMQLTKTTMLPFKDQKFGKIFKNEHL